ncbi:MAG: spermidine/putrescine ABC transporter substrate-binding protein, partial [Steroidobacteraceae bacterium]
AGGWRESDARTLRSRGTGVRTTSIRSAGDSHPARTVGLAVMLLLAAIGLPPRLLAAELPVLRILNWEEYLDPEVAAEFGRRHGVRVEETHFDSDSERDRKLAANGATGFDLAIVDASQIAVYRDRGWIEPIGESRVPGLRELDNRWRRIADGTATHTFPFAWGTVGIAYRADRLTRPPESWLALFQPAASLCGKVIDFSDARELVASALKATGQSANTGERSAYARAEQLLKAQRPCVAGYEMMGVTADSALITGKAWAVMSYNSDAVQARALDPNVRFVLPAEGGLIWADYFTVLASSKQKPLAFAFLQFLSDPGIAARVALFNQAATPNSKALSRLPATVREDAVIYPKGPALEASELIVVAPPAIVALRNQIQAQLVRKQ